MRLFRTISPRALKPGPKPDPALRAGDPKWFRRGRAINGPENYDPFEPRFYCGRSANRLAMHAQDHAERQGGYVRPGARERIGELTSALIKALSVYMKIKPALYLICCPFRFKQKNQPVRLAPQPVASKPRKIGKEPSDKDWAALNEIYGFDVRMTSPTYILRRAKHLRHILWDAPYKDIQQAHISKTEAAPKAECKAKTAHDFPVCEPDDLFTIWPPLALPDLPRSARRRAAKSLDDIRGDLYATPQPRPLSLISAGCAANNYSAASEAVSSYDRQDPPGPGGARASPRAKQPIKSVTEPFNYGTGQ